MAGGRGVELDDLQGPLQPKPFYDSMAFSSESVLQMYFFSQTLFLGISFTEAEKTHLCYSFLNLISLHCFYPVSVEQFLT